MKHKFTKDQLQFIRNNSNGKLASELTAELNKRFKTSITVGQVRSAKKNHKITSGLSKIWAVGHIPWNKGTTGLAKPNRTSFKKGNKPHNYLPVGSEVIDSDGYHKVKIKDPNIWEFKHRIVYEEQLGKIPKGHKIIFLDQDRSNLSLDNLHLIDSSGLLIMNSKSLIFPDPDLTKTGLIITKTLKKIYEVEKSVSS